MRHVYQTRVCVVGRIWNAATAPMKKQLVILAMLTTSAAPQDIHHAPNPDLCRADLAIWYGQSKTTIETIPAHDLDGRRLEMMECSDLFTDHIEREQAFGMENVYISHLQRRMERFLLRHDLMKQFADEDLRGAR